MDPSSIIAQVEKDGRSSDPNVVKSINDGKGYFSAFYFFVWLIN